MTQTRLVRYYGVCGSALWETVPMRGAHMISLPPSPEAPRPHVGERVAGACAIESDVQRERVG